MKTAIVILTVILNLSVLGIYTVAMVGDAPSAPKADDQPREKNAVGKKKAAQTASASEPKRAKKKADRSKPGDTAADNADGKETVEPGRDGKETADPKDSAKEV